MPLSDHEQRLLLTGTLDTSGVGGSPSADLPHVAMAFAPEQAVVTDPPAAQEAEPEDDSSAQVAKPTRGRRTKQATAPAES